MNSEAPPPTSKATMPLLAALCIVGIVGMRYGFLFFLVAILPSVIAWLIDHTELKSIFKTVLACNIAGMLPPLAMMFSGEETSPHSMAAAVEDPRIWLIIYGAAAGGWCLVFLCRFITQFLVVITFEQRARILERKQEKLAEEWGQQIRQQG